MKVADQIFTFVKRLHPAQRRAIKSALRALETGAFPNSRALNYLVHFMTAEVF